MSLLSAAAKESNRLLSVRKRLNPNGRKQRPAAITGRILAFERPQSALKFGRSAMRAVVLEDTRQIVVKDVPDAEMKETTDVLLRVTSTAICGTDLHFYEGRMRGIEGGVIGHEPLCRIGSDEIVTGMPNGEPSAISWTRLFASAISPAVPFSRVTKLVTC